MKILANSIRGLLLSAPFLATIANAQSNCIVPTTGCSSFTNVFGSGSSFGTELEVPCGQCISLGEFTDGSTLDLAGGLNVAGTLYIPAGTSLDINAQYIKVGGSIEMKSTTKIDGTPSVSINLTGEGVTVLPGGSFNVDAIPETCPTWVPLKATGKAPMPQPTVDMYPQPNPIPAGCSATVLSDFKAWKTSLGAESTLNTTDAGKEFLFVTNRNRNWQGVTMPLDVTGISDCLVADKTYLLSASVMLTRADDVRTRCEAFGRDCPEVTVGTLDAEGQATYRVLGEVLPGAYIGDGEWFTLAVPVIFTAADLSSDNMHIEVFISGPEAFVDMSITDIVLETPSETAYPAPPASVCQNLIVNGDASASAIHPYPWYAIGPRSTNLAVGNEGDNPYFVVTGRKTLPFSSLQTDLVTGCVVESTTYEFSAKVQVMGVEEDVVSVILKSTDPTKADSVFTDVIATCPPSSATTGFVECKASFTFTEAHANAKDVQIFFTADSNVDDDMKVDDVSMELIMLPVETLKVSSAVAECWDVGAEVVVTSPSLEAADSVITKITSVTVDGAGTMATLTVETKLQAYTSAAEDKFMAVEVALLSREISVMGGSLKVMGESSVRGVEFLGMGSIGELDNYPVQISGLEQGTMSQNTIRASQNRCIVLTSTSGVTVSQNVAYDTFGHCFTVDGGSSSNIISKNIGMLTKAIPKNSLVSLFQSDYLPATFWTASPDNAFESNVAAGSEWHGFWFQIDTAKESVALGSFVNNIAHSNEGDGVTLYPNGYLPATTATLENTKSYLNKGYGMTIHRSTNVKVYKGLFSDNRMGVSLRRSDKIHLSSLKITGVSATYKAVSKTMSMATLCPAHRAIVGVQLMSNTQFPHHTGSSLENIAFENFTEETTDGCVGSTALNTDGYGDIFNDVSLSFTGLSFLPADTPHISKFSACDLAGAGAKEMAIDDVGGSLNPTDGTTPGFIISDSSEMTRFTEEGSCFELEGSCALYCPGVKFAPVVIATSSANEYADVVLQVYSGDTVQSYKSYFEERTYVDHRGIVQVDQYENYGYERRRFFQPLLLSGKDYTFKFRKGVAFVWPRFVEYDKAKTVPYTFTFDAPPAGLTCTSGTIANDKPTLETGMDHWTHTGGNIGFHRGGYGSHYAIRTQNRAGGWQGVGQFLDSRCFSAGMELEIKGYFRLLNPADNSAMECDPSESTYLATNSCPRLSMILRKVEGGVTTTYLYPAASAVHPYASTWTQMHGVFTFSAEMEEADSIYIFAEGGRSDADILFGGLTITPKVLTCTDSSFNRDMEYSDSKFWGTMGKANTKILAPGKDSRYALTTTFRDTYFSSMSQSIFPDCLSQGASFSLSADINLFRNGVPFSCDPSATWDTSPDTSCPVMSMKIWTASGTTKIIDIAKFSTFTPGTWNTMTGEFVATEEMVLAEKMEVFWQKVIKEVEIQIDNFSMATIQTEGCSSLVYGGDFETPGFGNFRPYGNGFVDKVAGGYSSNMALVHKSRVMFEDGVMYPLNKDCIPRKSIHKFTAKVKMVAQDGTPVACDYGTLLYDGKPLGDQKCPHATIVAQTPGSVAQVRPVAGPTMKWVANSWNSIVGYFYWNPNEWYSDTLYLYLGGAPGGIDLIVDSVGIERLDLAQPVDRFQGVMVNETEFIAIVSSTNDLAAKQLIFNVFDTNNDGSLDAGWEDQCMKEVMTLGNRGIDNCFYVAIPSDDATKTYGTFVPPKTESPIEEGVTGLKVYLTQGDTIATSSAAVEGFTSQTLSADQAASFGIGDAALKSMLERYYGQNPTSVKLSSPTGETDLYSTMGWPEVEMNIGLIGASVTGIEQTLEVLDTGSYTSDAAEDDDYAGLMSYDFALSTTHDWNGFNSGGSGDISYQVTLTGSGVVSATDMAFAQTIGSAEGFTQSNVLNVTSANPMLVSPGQTVYTQLAAIKNTMKVQLRWSSHLSGRAAVNYSPKTMNGFADWGIWLPPVMNYNVGSTYIGCYVERFTIKDFPVFVADGMAQDACAVQCKKYGYPYFARSGANKCSCSDSYGLYPVSDKCTCDQEGDLGVHNCVYEVGETLTPSSMTLVEEIAVTYYTNPEVKVCATEAECSA